MSDRFTPVAIAAGDLRAAGAARYKAAIQPAFTVTEHATTIIQRDRVLRQAALEYAAAELEETGESGSAAGALLLRQIAEAL